MGSLSLNKDYHLIRTKGLGFSIEFIAENYFHLLELASYKEEIPRRLSFAFSISLRQSADHLIISLSDSTSPSFE